MKGQIHFTIHGLIIGIIIVFTASPTLAHPGNTDSLGGHHCWTNCSYWGYYYGEYHFHDDYLDDSWEWEDDFYDDTSYGSFYLPSYTTKQFYSVADCSIYAETFEEVNNFNIIYNDELNRNADCDELNFHVDHVTPHDRLRSWLRTTQEYFDVHSSNLAGCKFYDPYGNNHAIMIYNAYVDITAREPRCDELKAHASWGTSLQRLQNFLEPYKYSMEGKVYYKGTLVPSAKINIYLKNIYQKTIYTDENGVFMLNDLEPNEYYRFKVEGPVAKNFKILPLANQKNTFVFSIK